MDVAKVLSDSWQAVVDSGVPEEFREVAFNRAVDLYGYTPVVGTLPIQTPPPPPADNNRAEESYPAAKAAKKAARKPATANGAGAESGDAEIGDAPNKDEFYERLVDETKADRELIEDVLAYSAKKPTLNVTGRQLGSTQKQKQVAIAVLLTVARQIGLKETVTSVAIVREECEQFRCADRNLSENIRNTKGLRLTGDKRTKDIQVRNPALDLFKTEIERITGGGDSESSDND